MNKFTMKTLRGKEIEPYIMDLAALRIQVFRDYPYLYEGEYEYEKKYLQAYLDCDNSTLIIVLDDNKIVGASTAIPLKNEIDKIQEPFIQNGYNVNDIFYFGESVLLKNYRGQKIGEHFFNEREKAARKLKHKIVAFCGVIRSPDDPRRPADWFPLDAFWQRMGFTKHPELTLSFSWKEIGEEKESPKPMVFWLKNLKD